MDTLASSPLPDEPIFWLTRDRVDGELAEIEIWLVPPVPQCYPDGDLIWLPSESEVDKKITLYGDLSIEAARRAFGENFPTSERDCICVIRELHG